MTDEKLAETKKIFAKYCEKNDFILNPDEEHTDTAIIGVLKNEELTGLKYCPCRLKTGDFSKDVELLCPCNFEIQKTWMEKGECWCGLFVKKNK